MMLLLVFWIVVHAPDGARIEVNIDSIVAVRPPREHDKRTISKDVNCMILTADAKIIAVVETCEQVMSAVPQEGEKLP